MLINRFVDQVKKEPLAFFAIVVALLVPLVPSCSDILEMQKSKAEEYVFLCSRLEPDSVKLHENVDSGGHYSLLYPTTCTFTNNTSKSVSISEYGPRLIDNQVSYSMIGKSSPYPTITLAPKLSQIVEEDIPLPRLLSAREQFVFKSVIAIPIGKKLLDNADKKCKEPSVALLKTAPLTICKGKKRHLLGNYTNLYFSVGFLGWNKYGSGIRLGSGKEVVYQTPYEFTPLSCEQEGGKSSMLCRESRSGSYTLPKSYWTNSRGYF